MRQPKRPRVFTAGPPSAWLAEIQGPAQWAWWALQSWRRTRLRVRVVDRLSRLVGIHEHRHNVFDRNAICGGNPAAVALTIATAIFFGSGEAYHRAWANGFPPDTKLTQIGDLFSGFGAIALGVGLYLLGNPVLAATSGLLHAAGKFGSAFNAKGKLSIAGRNIDASVFCRIVVLISRAPALIAISADILSSRARDDGSFAFISLVMLACYLIWSVADLMLLTRDNVLKRLFRPISAADPR